MKNFLIILENIDKTINHNVKSWLNEMEGIYERNIDIIINQKDFKYIILKDNNNLEDIISNSIIKQVRKENKDVKFYIVLHNSALSNDIEGQIMNFKNEFATPHVIGQSHFENEGFYYDKMPLLIQESVVEFSVIIEGYFETDDKIQENDLLNTKLNILHKLLGNKLTKSELEQLPKVTTDIKVDRIKYIKEVRDKLLEKI